MYIAIFSYVLEKENKMYGGQKKKGRKKNMGKSSINRIASYNMLSYINSNMLN